MKYKFRYFRILLLVGVVFISACASTASVSLEEKEATIAGYELPMMPGDKEAVIYVLRPDAFGGAVRFKIFLDGEKEDGKYIGYTRGEQYLSFAVSAGEHVVNSKAENWGAVTVSAEAGDIVYLKQTPQIGLLFSRNLIEEVDSVEGQYLMVKYKLEPGTYVDEE